MILFIYIDKPIHSLSAGLLMFDVFRFFPWITRSNDTVIGYYFFDADLNTIKINYEYTKNNSYFYAGAFTGV